MKKNNENELRTKFSASFLVLSADDKFDTNYEAQFDINLSRTWCSKSLLFLLSAPMQIVQLVILSKYPEHIRDVLLIAQSF